MEATIFSIVFALLSGTYIFRSFRIVEEGEVALVERFGKYQKTLTPGINMVLPILDRVALIKTSREQVLELKPQPCMTSDNVSVNVSGSMYWQIIDLKKARYNINDIDKSLIPKKYLFDSSVVVYPGVIILRNRILLHPH